MPAYQYPDETGTGDRGPRNENPSDRGQRAEGRGINESGQQRHDTAGQGSMLAAALHHAAAGRSVFPCRPDKTPWTAHGFKDATADTGRITAWWTAHPTDLIGMPTGWVTRCFALDVDNDPATGKDGEESLAKLLNGHEPLPDTVESMTPRGGRHLIFRHPGPEFEVPCSASKLGSDLDVRGDGGYIILPPSTLPDGRCDQWEGSSDPDEGVRAADAPDWLLALVAVKKSEKPTTQAPDAGGERILEGARNATLFSLGRSLRAKGLTENGVLAALQAENEARCTPPLSESEIAKIAASACAKAPGRSVEYARPEEPPPWGETSEPAGWPEPQPLTAKVRPEPYPVDALPATIRAAVEEVAGFVKAPLPLVASSALAALSVACQAHIDAKRAEKLQGPTGLYLLTIADSGERKTTCDGFFASAIRRYEAEQADAAKPELERHKAKFDAWNAERDGLLLAIKGAVKGGKSAQALRDRLMELQGEKPEPPKVPRLLLGDETPENLAWSLAKQWPSSGVVSSEAGLIFGSHGMGKDSILRNLALLNVLWDGGTHSVGRRTSECFTVRGARLTVGLQVQEATLRSFFERDGGLARGTGFLARFLLAWPESTQGYRPFTEAPENWPHLAGFHARIAAILALPAPLGEDGTLSPVLLPLTPAAKTAWVAYHNAIEGELRTGGELYDVRDVASKTADNAVRLAALFQIFEGGPGAVGLEAFEGASRIAAWHLNEARRFFGELALPAELADAVRLDAWLIGYCQRERTRDVGKHYVRQHGPIRDGKRLDAALRELADLDRLRLAKDGKRLTIRLHPDLVEVAP